MSSIPISTPMLIMSTGTGSMRLSHMARPSGASNARHYVPRVQQNLIPQFAQFVTFCIEFKTFSQVCYFLNKHRSKALN
jgi:hypothetical protein